MKTSQSLRKKLLLWLLIPLSALILIDSSILYGIAMDSQKKAFDNELLDSAHDISQLITMSSNPDQLFNLPPTAKQLILTDEFDEYFYSIINAAGKLVGGEKDLHISPKDQENISGPHFYFDEIHNKRVRVVSMPIRVNTYIGPQQIHIQVAETLNKRKRIADKILIGIIVPQLILVVIAVGIVWFGIGRGLLPLWELQSAVAKRSHRDLSAIKLPHVPREAMTLVGSINMLMLQVQNVLESQNRFIADAAHQLRTPLAGVQAQLELVQQERDPQQLQDMLQHIGKSMERLSRTISQLLSLARSQPEVAKTLTMMPVDLNQLAHDVTTEMVPAAFQKDIDLGYEAPQQAIFIEGDTQRLKELLYNLIDNAIRYIPTGGKVTVQVTLNNGQVILAVEDNGPGIPLEEQQKVFERFHRVIGTGQDGSGLGLAIVMEIAHIHNASVELGSVSGISGVKVQVLFEECRAQ